MRIVGRLWRLPSGVLLCCTAFVLTFSVLFLIRKVFARPPGSFFTESPLYSMPAPTSPPISSTVDIDNTSPAVTSTSEWPRPKQTARSKKGELLPPSVPSRKDPMVRLGSNKKRFLYLVMVESKLASPHLYIGPDSDLAMLCWKTDCSLVFPYAYFAPGTSWTSGRNKMVEIALSLKNDYQYFVFVDGDIKMERKATFKDGHIDSNPYRVFEFYVLKYMPPLATVRSWHVVDPKQEVHGLYVFDAMFTAFHRDSMGFL
jgi:hypothetical protein